MKNKVKKWFSKAKKDPFLKVFVPTYGYCGVVIAVWGFLDVWNQEENAHWQFLAGVLLILWSVAMKMAQKWGNKYLVELDKNYLLTIQLLRYGIPPITDGLTDDEVKQLTALDMGEKLKK